MQEIVAQRQDPKYQSQKQAMKKETKKDVKKDSKVEDDVAFKNSLNGYDLAFISINLPENLEELKYFFENQGMISSLFLYTK